MPHADFVHLRVHSAYSLSEGAIPVKTLVKLCEKQSMPAVAATHNMDLAKRMDRVLRREPPKFLPASCREAGFGSERRVPCTSRRGAFGLEPTSVRPSVQRIIEIVPSRTRVRTH